MILEHFVDKDHDCHIKNFPTKDLFVILFVNAWLTAYKWLFGEVTAEPNEVALDSLGCKLTVCLSSFLLLTTALHKNRFWRWRLVARIAVVAEEQSNDLDRKIHALHFEETVMTNSFTSFNMRGS